MHTKSKITRHKFISVQVSTLTKHKLKVEKSRKVRYSIEPTSSPRVRLSFHIGTKNKLQVTKYQKVFLFLSHLT